MRLGELQAMVVGGGQFEAKAADRRVRSRSSESPVNVCEGLKAEVSAFAGTYAMALFQAMAIARQRRKRPTSGSLEFNTRRRGDAAFKEASDIGWNDAEAAVEFAGEHDDVDHVERRYLACRETYGADAAVGFAAYLEELCK